MTLDKPTPFELLCAQGPYQTHHLYMQRLSLVTQHPIALPQWQKIWEAISKSSRCVEQRETAYKILFFWYRTPEILQRYDPRVPRVCWKCHGEVGSHYHIF